MFTKSASNLRRQMLQILMESKGFAHLIPLLNTPYIDNTELRRQLCMTVLVAPHMQDERPVKQPQPGQQLDDKELIASLPELVERLMVRDEHVTGKGKDGKLTKFKQQGCKVSPQTTLSLSV